MSYIYSLESCLLTFVASIVARIEGERSGDTTDDAVLTNLWLAYTENYKFVWTLLNLNTLVS